MPHPGADTGCPSRCSGRLQVAGTTEFVGIPRCRDVVRQDMPPSSAEDADDDPGRRFRHGWFHAERVHPAGPPTHAITGGLRHDG